MNKQNMPLGIIAGGGDIPLILAESLHAKGKRLFILAIEGECDRKIEKYPHSWLNSIGCIGEAVEHLKKAGCRQIVMIGSMKRPNLKTLRVDKEGVKFLAKLLPGRLLGDDHVLSKLIAYFEKKEFEVLGAEQILEELTAPQGVLGKYKPSKEAKQSIRLGRKISLGVGKFDIGQASVICNGVVLALEAAEGTAKMLENLASLPTEKRKGGVLVKLPKPNQERRVDLPCLGPKTVELAAKAGLSGIAFEAGGALLIHAEEMIALAERERLFLIGIAREGADKK